MTDAQRVLVARNAMATRFEIVLHGGDAPALRAAGEEALDEIERLEAQLSLYRSTSEIAHLNARAHAAPVRVTPSLFRLLERARDLSRQTGGAFDVTVAPLVRCWGFMGGSGSLPSEETIAQARECVGMQWLELDPVALTVRFARAGVMIDLGAIGKGYAIDKAAEILREAGVTSALVHGGTSSAYGIGHPPGDEKWKIAVSAPGAATSQPLTVVELEDNSLSVSAVWGKSFAAGQQTYGHIIDPRTGRPAQSALLAAVIVPSATDGDALSTALLTDPGLLETLASARPELRCLLASGAPAAPSIVVHGGLAVFGKSFETPAVDP